MVKSYCRERDVLRQCLDLLKIRKIFHFRNNTGGMSATHQGKERFIHFGVAGGSDILGVLPRHSRKPGVLIALECKRPGGRTTTLQEAFLANVEAAGGVAAVIDDVVKLDELLTDLGC
jgi:hypothetical protein